ncbi:hypothetical protein ACFL1I_03695, partial [Candidatus Omnitrophota bacterium]
DIYKFQDKYKTEIANCLKVSLSAAFNKLSNVSCSDCWCAPRIEAHYLLSFDWSALWNAIWL